MKNVLWIPIGLSLFLLVADTFTFAELVAAPGITTLGIVLMGVMTVVTFVIFVILMTIMRRLPAP